MSRQDLESPSQDVQQKQELLRHQRPLVIERPDLQSFSQRWGYRSVTVFAWLAWLYLFIPILSALAWIAGLTLAYRLLLQGLEVAELWALLKVYAIGIGIFCAIYLSWAAISFIRFRGVGRRKTAPDVSTEVLAASHGLAAADIEAWRKSTNQVIAAETLEEMFAAQREGLEEELKAADQPEQ